MNKEFKFTKLNGELVTVNIDEVECYSGCTNPDNGSEYTRFYMKNGEDFGVKENFKEVDDLIDPR